MFHQQLSNYALALIISILGVSGCGGGGGGGGGGSNDNATTVTQSKNINGQATKGPLQGADISFWTVSASGTKGTQILSSGDPVTATTDNTGAFNVTLPDDSISVLVVTDGGTYYDEADQEGLRQINFDDENLEALLLPNQSTVAITPFTQALLLKSRQESDGSDFLEVYQRNKDFYAEGLGFDITTTLSANPVAPGSSATADALAYAQLLGGAANAINAIALGVDMASPEPSAVHAFIEDMADGDLDGKFFGSNIQVNSQNIPNIDFGNEIERFRHNNYSAYPTNTPIPGEGDSTSLDRTGRTTDVSSLSVSDSNLQACIQAEITDNSHVYLEDIYSLSCENKNISSLSGINQLTNLENLFINNNDIEDLDPLSGIPTLRLLYANGNANLQDIDVLFDLHEAQDIQLTGTDKIQCGDIETLENTFEVSVLTLPSSCIPLVNTLTFPDEELDDCIHGEWDGYYLDAIDELDCEDWGIADLSGIEQLTEMQYLDLEDNEIVNVSPLQSLIYLKSLDLDSNYIVDISPLNTLVNLLSLDIEDNPLTNISSLPSMVSLTNLYLYDSPDLSVLPDLSPLSNLEVLNIYRTNISDISGLSGLTSLTDLYLAESPVHDISPLGSISSLEYLDLYKLEITTIGDLSGMMSLIDLFIRHSNLSSLTGLETLASISTLDELDLESNTFTDVTPLAALTLLPDLYLYNNLQLETISPLQALTNTNIVLTGNRLIRCDAFSALNTALASGTGSAYMSSACRDDLLISGITITDSNLATCIANTAASQTASLTALDCSNQGIADLSGLEDFHFIENLNLSMNNISSLTPLANLVSLTELNLSDNSISDDTGIESLDRLEKLILSGNSINGWDTFSSLSSLTYLDLSGSNMGGSNYPLRLLINLEYLNLADIGITSTQYLGTLINIEELHLENNALSSITELFEMTKATFISLDGNSDPAICTDLDELETALPLLSGANFERPACP